MIYKGSVLEAPLHIEQAKESLIIHTRITGLFTTSCFNNISYQFNSKTTGC